MANIILLNFRYLQRFHLELKSGECFGRRHALTKVKLRAISFYEMLFFKIFLTIFLLIGVIGIGANGITTNAQKTILHDSVGNKIRSEENVIIRIVDENGEVVKNLTETLDTLVYSKFGSIANTYEIKKWALDANGKSIVTRSELKFKNSRIAWEILLLYSFLIVCYIMIGRITKTYEEKGLLLVRGSLWLLLTGIFYAIVLIANGNTSYGLLVMEAATIYILLNLFSVSLCEKYANFHFIISLIVGPVLFAFVLMGVCFHLWHVFLLCLGFALVGFVVGRLTVKS